MKKFAIIFLLVPVIGFLSGCKKDDDPQPTEEDLQREAISATWGMGTASLDGDDRTADWAGFTLTVNSNGNYNTTSSFDAEVWPESGFWDFQGTTGAGLNVFVRDGSKNIDIAVTETSLTLTFTIPKAELDQNSENTRVKGIDGEWVFSLVKQ